MSGAEKCTKGSTFVSAVDAHSLDSSKYVQESIAVTQNYASSANLKHVLAFLKDGRTEMVSGCPFEQRGQLHDAFVSALKKERPEV